LWFIDDPGVTADVYRLHAEEARAPDFRRWKARIEKHEHSVHEEWREYYEAVRVSRTRRDEADAHLKNANMLSRALAHSLKHGDDFHQRTSYYVLGQHYTRHLEAGQGLGQVRTCDFCGMGCDSDECETPHY